MSNFWSKIDENLLLEAMLAIWRPTWANIMASWAVLEATWSNMSQHGANMSQHGANMEPTWSQHGANMEPTRGQLEGWGMSPHGGFFRGSQLGANMGQLEPTWNQLGPNMTRTWANLEPAWLQVGPILAQKKQTWSNVEVILRPLEPCRTQDAQSHPTWPMHHFKHKINSNIKKTKPLQHSLCLIPVENLEASYNTLSI